MRRSRSSAQEVVYKLFQDEYDELKSAPRSTIRPVATSFTASTVPPTSKQVVITQPSKKDFFELVSSLLLRYEWSLISIDVRKTTSSASFYGQAIHGTRSAGKVPENRFAENALPIPDAAFDAPVENAEELFVDVYLFDREN